MSSSDDPLSPWSRPRQRNHRLELVADAFGGTVVMLDGHAQSYVKLADPELLAFEYTQFLGAVVDSLEDGPLAVTHVGGAGLTMARYISATRPGSSQIVLEPDTEVTDAVRAALPLPRGQRIRIRPVDGRAGLLALADASADLVILDAYAGGRVPAELTTVEWFTDVARVLRPAGVLAFNTADEPSRRHLARVHAGLASVMPSTAAICTPEVRKGRRFGNTVLVACREPLPVERLARNIAKAAFSASFEHSTALTRSLGSAKPFRDADARPSPPPPVGDAWRVR